MKNFRNVVVWMGGCPCDAAFEKRIKDFFKGSNVKIFNHANLFSALKVKRGTDLFVCMAPGNSTSTSLAAKFSSAPIKIGRCETRGKLFNIIVSGGEDRPLEVFGTMEDIISRMD